MIERQIHLSSGGGAALQGYDGLLRFGYTRNRGIYALRVEADGEWQGMTLRAFWHRPADSILPAAEPSGTCRMGTLPPPRWWRAALWRCPPSSRLCPGRGASPLRAPMAPAP